MLFKFFKTLCAFKEARDVCLCIYYRDSDYKKVKSKMLFWTFVLILFLPVILIRYIIKKLGLSKSDMEKSLALNSLFMAVISNSSYSEWRSAQKICSLIPAEIKEAAMMKGNEKNELSHLAVIIFFLHSVSYVLGGTRPETKEEFVDTVLENRGYILSLKDIEDYFESILELPPLEQIHAGRDVMYLRKSFGKKDKPLGNFFSNLVPGLNT